MIIPLGISPVCMHMSYSKEGPHHIISAVKAAAQATEFEPLTISRCPNCVILELLLRGANASSLSRV